MPSGRYQLHSSAKRYDVAGLASTFGFSGGLEISQGAKQIHFLDQNETIKLEPLSGENKEVVLHVYSSIFAHQNISANHQVCGSNVQFEGNWQEEVLMIVDIDMKQIPTLSESQMKWIYQSFPADFPTETENPKRWTENELREFRYFAVWLFSIPSVTGGIIFIPLEKVSEK